MRTTCKEHCHDAETHIHCFFPSWSHPYAAYLRWPGCITASGVDRGAVGEKTLALIVSDPDAPDPAAPKMTWVHWVLYNLPVDSTGLQQGIAGANLPAGTREGVNDWHRTGYGGPCPPIGRHRYFFKLLALDTILPDLGKPAKAALEKAMQGHVLADTELMGTYQR